MNKWRKILLFPFGVLYHLITLVRNKCYDFNCFSSTSFSTPVICIGNLAVGGTGKTPHTEYLIRLLQPKYNVAVLSRGYGRKTKNYLEATVKTTAKEIGDEPFLYHKKHPKVLVAVENKRVLGVKKILQNHPNTDVILLDDAFQHRAIQAGFNIVITEYNNPLYNDYLLPAGNLREHKSGIKRSDIIIVSKCPNHLSLEAQNKIRSQFNFHKPEQIYFTKIAYGKIYNPFFPNKKIENLSEYSVLLVTGIGNSKPLYNHIKKYANNCSEIAFGDHHNFTEQDINKIKTNFSKINDSKKLILTTEKDASRFLEIKDMKKMPLFCIEIEVVFLNNKDNFNTQIEKYVRKNNTNSRIS